MNVKEYINNHDDNDWDKNDGDIYLNNNNDNYRNDNNDNNDNNHNNNNHWDNHMITTMITITGMIILIIRTITIILRWYFKKANIAANIYRLLNYKCKQSKTLECSSLFLHKNANRFMIGSQDD